MKAKNRNPFTEQCKNRSLSDKAYDLLGELLLEQETNQMLDELNGDKANGTSAEMDAFFAAHDRANTQRIYKYFQRRRLKGLLTKTLPRAFQLAAIVIACISIVGSIALATNKTARVYVMKLIAIMSDEYTSLKLVEDEEASFDVPAGWQGKNYPSYLPADLQVLSIHSYADYHSVAYQSAENSTVQLDFSELGSGAETNIDTEDATVCAIMIRDYPGFLVMKKEDTSLYWSDGQSYFLLFAQNIDKDVLLEIAESVKMIP
ncbi:MAG: DUF4367 domain-containing protein [Clostridiales bacterium]|nr:DUF4367 domain-containing protein [Clostridiales bacterium]MDO4349879.1 DUF4367 domain-containing protein [Eubacteriales bacterium]MDY4007649.1 DUF4367 domain-containing protein [Candidatus Limiplasma sp.]